MTDIYPGTKIVPRIVYLCNGKRCGESCTYPSCKATTDVGFATDISIPFERVFPTGDLAQIGCF